MASLRESGRKKYYLQILNYENFNNNLKASFFLALAKRLEIVFKNKCHKAFKFLKSNRALGSGYFT